MEKTEWDVNKSTQMHYDKYWMPYIVINTEELINFIIAEKNQSLLLLTEVTKY